MCNEFVGEWTNSKNTFFIKNSEKTYICSLKRANIGIIFKEFLAVSEFDEDAKVGGAGVYSKIGDGSSLYALWSSTDISGRLGSGIARKQDESPVFTGEYLITYFVGNK